MKEVSKAGEERLLGSLVAGLVLKHLVSERLAEVQSLQHRVAVASVAKLGETGTQKSIKKSTYIYNA